MPKERRRPCKECGRWIRVQYLSYHLKINHPDEKAAGEPRLRKRASGKPLAERCPICQGVVDRVVLDWHLAKYHDNGRPLVFDDVT